MPIDGEIIFDASDAQEFLESLKERFGSIKRGSQEMGGIIGAAVFQDIMDHFYKQSGPDGPWAPWSNDYAKLSRELGYERILQRSGRLRDAVTPGKYRPTQEGVIFYNDALTADGFPYARYHDEDARKARPFMWVGEGAMDRIAEQLLDWIADVN